MEKKNHWHVFRHEELFKKQLQVSKKLYVS